MTNETTQENQAAAEKRGKSSTERIFGAEVISHGFTGVPNILVRAQSRLGISTTQFNIIVQLLSYWIDPTRPPFPPKRELAQRMSITQQTLRINIKALEDKGYISRIQQKTAAGDYGSNIYRLDGLVAKIKELVPDFDEERDERRKARTKTEIPNARRNARRSADKG
ncbi:helix-turn-helix domain-containing protein [Mesorhizobium sp. SP-1A]|uniref:helix-turn-helix domain-containing protein n=1 Tax=Mesorhizobium sp. SP-1A TaxID=3077840 RepID=UPI0028F6DF18|nr:helix-turn-helix domain-containing protein [Mesorhizobium sp. SP-1A]